jgi:uncharacterized protein (DUF169 family)/NAD-dependent dihydropyrimidine dehydrogenase PreA subunit
MIKIEIDEERCSGCNFCVDFCPTSVFDAVEVNGRQVAHAARTEDCWACMACVGQCPEKAITVTQSLPSKKYVDDENEVPFTPLDEKEKKTYADLSASLERVLKLRWRPVAVTLIPRGQPLPHVPVPGTRLRYCQSLMIARRGKSLLMPPEYHACADGTSILGLTEIPPKLATGDVYIKLGKVTSIEAARRLVAERISLPARSVRATLVTPLAEAVMKPDVVVVIAPPESMMWLCLAATYDTGRRLTFKMGCYNAQCLETTLYPYTSGEINASLGCYGCRAISDIGEDMMFMGIPTVRLASLVDGLEYLGQKAIPDSRAKIYLPPLV